MRVISAATIATIFITTAFASTALAQAPDTSPAAPVTAPTAGETAAAQVAAANAAADAKKNACEYDFVEGAYKQASTSLDAIGPNVAATALLTTSSQGDDVILVFNPDGKLRGRAPKIREDANIYAVVYRAKDAGRYDVEVSGCKAPSTRILGEKLKGGTNEVNAESPPDGLQVDWADAIFIGKCSSDSAVTVKIKVPDQKACSARTETTVVTTEPVYRFLLGLAATIYIGQEFRIGLTDGVGGSEKRVTEEEVWSPPAARLILGWYPWGYAPSEDYSRKNLFLGTAIDVANSLDSANLAVGYALSEGVNVFVGVEPCRNIERLADEVRNGDVFEDSEDDIPRSKTWNCGTWRGFVGLSGTTEIIGRFFKKD